MYVKGKYIDRIHKPKIININHFNWNTISDNNNAVNFRSPSSHRKYLVED